MRSSVVLPQPLSPTSDTISFSATVNETWRSTGSRESFSPGSPRTRNVFDTSSTASLMRSGMAEAISALSSDGAGTGAAMSTKRERTLAVSGESEARR